MEKTNALRTGLAKALNTEPTPGQRLAMNVELPVGEIPEWIELLPAGEISTMNPFETPISTFEVSDNLAFAKRISRFPIKTSLFNGSLSN